MSDSHAQALFPRPLATSRSGGSRWSLVLLLLLALAALARAAVPGPDSWKPQGYVSDFANVLTPAQVAELDRQAAGIQQRLGVQVAMVTVPTIGGASVFNYSYELAHHWGIGQKGKDNGILIFLAIQDHKYYVQVGYGLEPYITDADAGTWMRALLSNMRAGNFDVVFGAMLSNIDQTLTARMGQSGAIPPQQQGQAPQRHSGGGLLQSLGTILFFLIVFLVMAAVFSGGRGCGPLGCLLPFLGGWGGGWGGGGLGGGNWGGGGGFGGFGGGGGGGGGFGGFGGGDFGGGGAGGSW